MVPPPPKARVYKNHLGRISTFYMRFPPVLLHGTYVAPDTPRGLAPTHTGLCQGEAMPVPAFFLRQCTKEKITMTRPPSSPCPNATERTQFAPDAESDTVAVDSIPDDWMGLDVGPKTIAAFEEAVAPCKTIVSEGEGRV